MNKFQKRITKLAKNYQTAVVVGNAFGRLEELLEIFDTVFVVAAHPPSIKARNLVYRESFDQFEQLADVNFMFYDLTSLEMFRTSMGVWNRNRPIIIIEGKEVIGRNLSGPLYTSSYNAVHQEEEYHVWKMKQ